MLFKLEIGDYSEDGYGVHEPMNYRDGLSRHGFLFR